jgi:multicomponent Na+:H+ antiporter subunit E
MLDARASHPLPGGGAHALELLRCLAFCAWCAVQGGLDVARRALHPRWTQGRFGRLETHSRLPEGPARLFLLGVVGLLPGAFAVETQGDVLTLHLLDASPELKATALARLRDLEARVARAFGLPPPSGGLL